MSVRIFSICGLVLAVASAWGLYGLDPARQPQHIASELAKENHPDRAKLIDVSAEAVRRDSANAYAWGAFGQALVDSGRVDEARQAMKRATELGQNVPQIWFNDAVFHFKIAENAFGLRSVGRVLAQVSDYDDTFFDYFDRVQMDPGSVLAEFGENQRAAQSYAKHLIATGNIDAAQRAWHILQARRFTDDSLTVAYVSGLLEHHRYEAARDDWAASRERSDYPKKNLVFNGDFEQSFSGCPLDWEIKESKDFDTTRDDSMAHEGRWSLKIRFHGDANVDYANVMQTVRVHPGNHEFRAWIRTDAVTTDQGIRIQIFDPENPARLDVRTVPVTGTHDWMPLEASFTVSENTNLIAIRVIRSPSLKFDNAITGTAWLDSVSLREES